jgi:hypothetical protein
MAAGSGRRKVTLSTAALESLREIWLWNAQRYGVHHADGYLRFLESEIEKLSRPLAQSELLASSATGYAIDAECDRKCPMNQLSSRKQHWLQFRLSTVLWFVLAAALAMGTFVARREADRLADENRQLVASNSNLRAEAGYLEIADPSKVNVLRIPVLDELSWRWKVWLPPGDWNLNCLIQGIPQEGVPNGASAGTIAGNREIKCSATVSNSPDGKWRFRGRADGTILGAQLPESHRIVRCYLSQRGMIASSCYTSGSKGSESFDAKAPIVLVRYRAHEIVTDAIGRESSKENPESSDGVMLWLTPVGPVTSQQGH